MLMLNFSLKFTLGVHTKKMYSYVIELETGFVRFSYIFQPTRLDHYKLWQKYLQNYV